MIPNDQRTLKSPLTYPNDKPRAVSLIASKIPEGVTNIVTPFLGGGSIELGLSSKDYNVTAFTDYRLLYDFWQCALSDPQKLFNMASAFYPMEDVRTFSMLQKKVYQPHDEYLRSALFYVLNHCSVSGSTTGGSIDPGTPRFSPTRISELADFNPSPFELQLDKPSAALETTEYLVGVMPEYMRTNLVEAVVIPERPQINHAKFATALRESDCSGWMLLYKYHSDLLDLYADSEMIFLKEGYRVTSNPDRATEVLIIGS